MNLKDNDFSFRPINTKPFFEIQGSHSLTNEDQVESCQQTCRAGGDIPSMAQYPMHTCLYQSYLQKGV